MGVYTEPSLATEALALRLRDLLAFNLDKATDDPASGDACLLWIDGFNAVLLLGILLEQHCFPKIFSHQDTQGLPLYQGLE